MTSQEYPSLFPAVTATAINEALHLDSAHATPLHGNVAVEVSFLTKKQLTENDKTIRSMIFAVERAAKFFGIEPDVFFETPLTDQTELEQMELPIPDEASDDEPVLDEAV